MLKSVDVSDFIHQDISENATCTLNSRKKSSSVAHTSLFKIEIRSKKEMIEVLEFITKRVFGEIDCMPTRTSYYVIKGTYGYKDLKASQTLQSEIKEIKIINNNLMSYQRDKQCSASKTSYELINFPKNLVFLLSLF